MDNRMMLANRSSKIIRIFAKLPFSIKILDKDFCREIKYLSNELRIYNDNWTHKKSFTSQIEYEAFDPAVNDWENYLDRIEYRVNELYRLI